MQRAWRPECGVGALAVGGAKPMLRATRTLFFSDAQKKNKKKTNAPNKASREQRSVFFFGFSHRNVVNSHTVSLILPYPLFLQVERGFRSRGGRRRGARSPAVMCERIPDPTPRLLPLSLQDYKKNKKNVQTFFFWAPKHFPKKSDNDARAEDPEGSTFPAHIFFRVTHLCYARELQQ